MKIVDELALDITTYYTLADLATSLGIKPEVNCWHRDLWYDENGERVSPNSEGATLHCILVSYDDDTGMFIARLYKGTPMMEIKRRLRLAEQERYIEEMTQQNILSMPRLSYA